MQLRRRLTQHDLIFGVYWGEKKTPNPGLNLWWRGRYIWPRQRTKIIPAPAVDLEEKLPFDKKETEIEAS